MTTLSPVSHHITTVIGADDSWQAKCTCRWRSPVTDRPDAVAAQDKHDAEVARTRAHLRTSTPSLRNVRDYYQRQADDPANTEDERALWRQLADELQPFIKARTDADQLSLWE